MARGKMAVIGYLNSDGFFPSYQLVILRSGNGETFVSWPKPHLKKIPDLQELLFSSQEYITIESNERNIEIDSANLMDADVYIAFSLRDNANDVELLISEEMHEHLLNLLAGTSLDDRERQIISLMAEDFWN
jgi:hypothetical protein